MTVLLRIESLTKEFIKDLITAPTVEDARVQEDWKNVQALAKKIMEISTIPLKISAEIQQTETEIQNLQSKLQGHLSRQSRFAKENMCQILQRSKAKQEESIPRVYAAAMALSLQFLYDFDMGFGPLCKLISPLNIPPQLQIDLLKSIDFHIPSVL